ncbi:MAG: right-handed parallel beta-helix repeat-containing protein, partial [Planctomycetota bacterium]
MVRALRAIGMFCGCALTTSVIGGDLTPPAGPIAETDRVTLNAQDITLPYNINTPGSYVLTSDLIATGGGPVIRVSVGNVTIDLNGFSIDGNSLAQQGVYVNAVVDSVVVKDGTVLNCTSYGIDIRSATGGRVENVVSHSNFVGIGIGKSSVLRNSLAHNNSQLGMACLDNSLIENCISDGAGNSGGILVGLNSIVRSCNSLNSASDGYLLQAGATAIDCVATSNTESGFRMEKETSLSGCVAR